MLLIFLPSLLLSSFPLAEKLFLIETVSFESFSLFDLLPELLLHAYNTKAKVKTRNNTVFFICISPFIS